MELQQFSAQLVEVHQHFIFQDLDWYKNMTFPTQTLSFNHFEQSQISYNRTVVATGVTQFTVPDGVYSMSAVSISGGGGGSGSNGEFNLGSAGGGGGGLTWSTFSVLPNDVLEIYIGEGGAGGGVPPTGSTVAITLDGTKGSEGGNSEIWLKSRGGTTYDVRGAGPNLVGIVLSEGGAGGLRFDGTGFGGSNGGGGAVPPEISVVPPPVQVYVYGGGAGGNGGICNDGRPEGAGGGGTGGYTGVGGNGGGFTAAAINPTGAALNSGGAGGGGYRELNGGDSIGIRGLGFGGGGVGAFGYDNNDPSDTGGPGANNLSGGEGGAYFNDPGFSINPAFIGSGSTDQSTFSLSNIAFDTVYSSIQPGDFILLISGADSTSGATLLSSPVGFTAISNSNNGQYFIDSSLSTSEIIPSNVTTNPTRDLNFLTAYQFAGDPVPTSIVGLDVPAIHNVIALRFIPNPSTFIWANDSYDPGVLAQPPSAAAIAAGAGFMPNPPEIGGISEGSLGIAFGFVANNILTLGGSISRGNSTEFTKISGGNAGIIGQGVAVMGQYSFSAGGSFGSPSLPVVSTNFDTTGVEINPDIFLTGTSSHARAYTIEIERSSTNPITLVGTASTADFNDNGAGNGSLNLPANIQNGDLIIYALSWDSPGNTSPIPNLPTGGAFTVFTDNGANVNANENGSNTNRFNGGSTDSRAIGGMRYQVSYKVWATGNSNTVNLSVNADGDTPSAHMIIVLRGATVPTNLNYAIWDNRTSDPLNPSSSNATSYGAPDPPTIFTAQTRSAIISFGMLDNITISQISSVTPPSGWTGLDEKSYGEPNDGAIVMSAYKTNLSAGSTNPGPFGGGGGNIWAAQTLVIGGPGQDTTGSNTSAGQWGGGGAARSEDYSSPGMNGAPGAVRLIWGGNRGYPYIDGNTGNINIIDFVP